MTPSEPPFEKLEKLILSSTPGQIARFLEGLDERQRKKLAGPTYKLHRRILTGEYIRSRGKPYANAPLAVVGTCPYEKAKRADIWTFGDFHAEGRNALIAILLDRRAKWTPKWIEFQLGRENMLNWKVIDALISAGVELDTTSDNFARHLSGQIDYPKTPLHQAIKERPYLLPVVWRLFEVDSNAFATDLSGHLGSSYESWPEALEKLSAEGLLCRQRLLDCSLEALNRDFPQNQLSGLIKFHQRMKPTAQELAARETQYLELLGVPHSRVPNFALRHLKKLKSLDGPAFLKAARPVLELPTKGSAISVLKILDKVLKEKPHLAEAAAGLVSEALTHPNRDVVEEAKQRLERLPGHQEFLPSPEPECDSENEAVELDRIEQRWIEALALDSPGLPGPLQLELGEIPMRLDRVTPIADLQELIDTVAAAVETCTSGLEVERILDGLSRLGHQRPADFEVRTAALAKRIREYPIGDTIRSLVGGWGGLSWVLRHALLSWLTGWKVEVPVHSYQRNHGAHAFLAARVEEVLCRILAGKSAPMLAAPGFARGWIEPLDLVSKIEAGIELQKHQADLVAALLRLHPCPLKRETALTAAQALKTPHARILRWALGGSEGPKRREKPRALWLAAARARGPRSDHSAELGFEAAPVSLTWNASPKNRIRWSGLPKGAPKPGRMASFLGALTGATPVERQLNPTLTCYDQALQSWETVDNRAHWAIDWLALMWPQNLDHYWVQAARCMADRLDCDAGSMYPNYAFLEPLFEVDRPWTEPAVLCLCLALVSKDLDLRGTGLDALIEGIEDGRAHPELLLPVLMRLYRQGSLKLNRLAESLGEVARSGELARWTVAKILGTVLADPLPKGAHHLLEQLLETTKTLPSKTRQNLRQVSGASKTAKLCQQLLKLPDPPPVEERFRHLLVSARLERARAWS